MGALDLDLMASIIGIMGTVVAFLVYLAPIPTFYWIYKKKSTQGFPSLPYSVALFCAMLTLYYACLKTNCMILIAINSIGCFIETVYLVIFMIYATPKSRSFTAKLLILFNILGFGLVILCTILVPNVHLRLKLVGWITIVFNVCVFAAPLSIMAQIEIASPAAFGVKSDSGPNLKCLVTTHKTDFRRIDSLKSGFWRNRRQVIITKSAEYMSFPLSLSLTLCAVMWFFYGLLIRDIFIAAPNVLGFVFGIVQMVMILVYRKKTKVADLPEFIPSVQLPRTISIPAPANDDMTVSIVINTKTKAGEFEIDGEDDDDDFDEDQLDGRPIGKPTVAGAFGLILRRGSI